MKSPLRSVASVLRTTAFPAHVPAADETASNPSTLQPLLGGGGGMDAEVVGGEAIDVVVAGVVVVVGAVVVATPHGDELEAGLRSRCRGGLVGAGVAAARRRGDEQQEEGGEAELAQKLKRVSCRRRPRRRSCGLV